ncbi:MAG TPA: hypothetical protein VM029_21705 [Opitutaceae bacterium]|nr:hypothetical protein [Opitutaceae bacterium]
MSFVSLVRQSRTLRIGLLLAAGLHLVSAAFHVYFGGINPDEGFYAIASRSVMAGDVPYRDFGYTQMPLLPYANGPFLALIGYGLFAQRWLNAAWAALALVLALILIARRTAPLLAAFVAVAFSLTPAWMYFTHLGKTYAFTALVAMIATWVSLEQAAGGKKCLLLGFLGVLGVGCRLPAAPFFAVLWLAALWETPVPRGRTVMVASLGLIAAAAILLLPFYLLAPENALFWALDFHAVSVPKKQWRLAWEEIATLAPLLWVALAATLGLAVARRNPPTARIGWLGAAALAALGANLLPRGVYEEYGVPFLLPLAVFVACELWRLTSGWSRRSAAALAGSLVVVHLCAAPLIIWQGGPRRPGRLTPWLPPNMPAYNLALPEHLARARSIVEQLVPPGRPLIGPQLILAAEARRPVPRNLRMGSFSLTADFTPERAHALNLLTYPELEAMFRSPEFPVVAFFIRAGPNYLWSMPSFREQPAADRQRWLEIFARDFLVVQQDSDFWLLARREALPP